jgi:hypothetical protein
MPEPVFPQTFRLRQRFNAPRVEDVPGEVHRELCGLGLGRRIRPGQTVAITAGSRGIANLARILRAAVEHLQGLGAEPFIVPAMGSHGGGTAEGQREVLASYGVTEREVGCPVRCGMETVIVCQTAEGFPVHFDRFASQADHVLVVNRVKPHTRFAGDIESGLMKMMLIGLGKRNGAEIYHRAILDYSFAQIVRSVAAEVIARCRVVGGLAIVENAYDQTARIAAVTPEEFETREKELLVLARQWMARLPFENVDLLLVDRIGKNISGTGLDTNVVGRKFNDHHAVAGEVPRVKTIALRGLTPETHGNAVGFGIAEFCKSQLLRETDLAATRLNAIVASHVSAAMPPLDYETDRRMLTTALSTIGMVEPADARLLWIRNTLELAEVECSAAYLEEAQQRADLEVLSGLHELPFDAEGNLPDLEFAAPGGH